MLEPVINIQHECMHTPLSCSLLSASSFERSIIEATKSMFAAGVPACFEHRMHALKMETEFVYKEKRKCLARIVKHNIFVHFYCMEVLLFSAFQTCTSSQTVVYLSNACVCERQEQLRSAAMEVIRFSAGKECGSRKNCKSVLSKGEM